MKKTAILSATGLLMATVPTVMVSSQAVAADSAKATIIDLSTYSADEDFPGYLCLDGEKLEGPRSGGMFHVTDSVGPLELTPGSHELAFVQEFAWSDELGCGDEEVLASPFSVDAGDNVTVGVSSFNPVEDSDFPAVMVWDNMPTCTEPGHARIGVRNAAVAYAEGGWSPLSVAGDVDGENGPIADGLEWGDQSRLDTVAPVEFVDVTVTADYMDDKLVVDGNVSLDPGDGQMLYLYGGFDGDVGIFAGPKMHPGVCGQVSTSIAPTTSTTSTIVEQQAQRITPRFAG